MTSRRDRMLQQLGITQWSLRRPAVLQGEVAVAIPTGIKLVVIAQTLPDLAHPLVRDVVQSLGLAVKDSYPLTSDQVLMLPDDTRCHSWWQGSSATRSLVGISLSSPSLATLMDNASAKRELWQQICQHEHDFSA